MNTSGIDLGMLLRGAIFFFVALVLLPVVVQLSAAKRTIVTTFLSAGFSIDTGWELKVLFVGMAAIIFISIPTWRILRIIHNSMK